MEEELPPGQVLEEKQGDGVGEEVIITHEEALLLSGATAHHCGLPRTSVPSPAADVDQAIALASSPVVRGHSGEVLVAIRRSSSEEESNFEWIAPEILRIILSQLDASTLMTAAPQVCRRWRHVCQDLGAVHLDFCALVKTKIASALYVNAKTSYVAVPLEAVAGWTSAVQLHAGSGGWVSGLCKLFPRTASVTMRNAQCAEEDSMMIALAEGCPGIKRVDFGCDMYTGSRLTDAAVTVLAKQCRGITHANFVFCLRLTDAAVVALAEHCSLVDFNFGFCQNVTDTSVVALAELCSGITHAKLYGCFRLTNAALIALATKCPRLLHVDFRGCKNLTDAAVIVLADKCPGLTYVDFTGCRKLTDAALIPLAAKCKGLLAANFNGCWGLKGATKAAVEKKHPTCRFVF